MWGKIIILAFVAVIWLTASCIFTTGAPVSPPGITSDNSGGAIVMYGISSEPDYYSFYVQRIGPEGGLLWRERGVLIGSGYSSAECPLHAVSDDSGGAIVIWLEFLQRPTAAPPPPPSRTHAAKIDSEGNVQWRRDIPGAKKAIPDGSGGAIIAYIDAYDNICVLKIGTDGSLPWGEDGVSLSLADAYSCSMMAGDNSGGVIVVGWTFGSIVRAQRIDSEGNILWQTGGVQVCAGPAEQPEVVSDGVGGAIIAYRLMTPCEGGRGGYCDSDIYAQRIDAEGNVLWGLDGVPICIGPSKPHEPKIVDDSAGGAIIFFADEHGLRAQRVDADGRKLWPEDVEVSAYASVVSDGFGGAISVWCGEEEGRAQRLDAMGGKMWGTDGITWTFRYKEDSREVSDGCGGVLISWSARKTSLGVASLSYVQRIDAEGNLLWGDEGILLNP